MDTYKFLEDPDKAINKLEKQVQHIPVAGWCAIGFGLLGIFTFAYVFVPLALILSIIALFQKQISYGFIGLLLTVAGFLTSPIMLGIVGLTWFSSWIMKFF